MEVFISDILAWYTDAVIYTLYINKTLKKKFDPLAFLQSSPLGST